MQARDSLMFFHLLWIISITILPTHAQQNLVPNPSFEWHTTPPSGISQIYLARPWVGFSTDSGPVPADYFNLDARNELASVPSNYLGYQDARTGDAYAGLIAYSEDYDYYREFIQIVLTEPLKADSLYQAEFYVSLAEKRTFAISNLGMLFTRVDPFLNHKKAFYSRDAAEQIKKTMRKQLFTKYRPQVANSISQLLTDSQQWVKISGTFQAEGGEAYLTIGNFTRKKNVMKQQIAYGHGNVDIHNDAYYYVDDVKVTGLYPPLTEKVLTKKIPESGQKPELVQYFGELEVNKPFVLKNVYFKSDEHVIQSESFTELDELYNLLQNNPEIKIAIDGHTDNTNTETYNLNLSQLRADAVQKYLVDKGIINLRIRSTGYGESLPIADNSNKAGKKLNRRVTFTILGN